MAKRDMLWVAIRVLGLYFITWIAPAICLIPFELYLVAQTFRGETPGIEMAYDVYASKATQHAFELLILIPLTYYLLRRGKWLLDFMTPEEVTA